MHQLVGKGRMGYIQVIEFDQIVIRSLILGMKSHSWGISQSYMWTTCHFLRQFSWSCISCSSFILL